MPGDGLADLREACLKHNALPGQILLLMHLCNVRTIVVENTHYELTSRGRLEITKVPAATVGEVHPQRAFPF